MERVFDNPHALPSLIAGSRIRELDPVAAVRTVRTPQLDSEGFPIPELFIYSVSTDTDLSDNEIISLLSTPQTVEETNNLNAFMAALDTLENSLPAYWNNDAQTLKNQSKQFWFGGQTRQQVLTSLSAITNAATRQAFEAVVNTLYDIQEQYVYRAIDMDVITRDYILRLRR